jgi:hypothetical protein
MDSVVTRCVIFDRKLTFCVSPLNDSHELDGAGAYSIPSFFNLYRNARKVMPRADAARVLL